MIERVAIAPRPKYLVATMESGNKHTGVLSGWWWHQSSGYMQNF